MNIYFNIDYDTALGEELVLHIGEQRYRMSSMDGRHWWYNLERVNAGTPMIDYHYSVESSGVTVRSEWTTTKHRLYLDARDSYTVYNRWNAFPEDSYRYSSAFTARQYPTRPAMLQGPSLRLIVRAPQLRKGMTLGIVGDCEALGEWDIRRAVPMTLQNYNEWAVDLSLSPEEALCQAGERIEFKFVVASTTDKSYNARTTAPELQIPMWEEGMNRWVEVPTLCDDGTVVYELDQSFYKLANERFAGTLIPVFSLRSEGGFGVGDFGDLYRMIDFVAATGQRVLQILPINDTTQSHTWTDSYPYNAISIFALHPQYIDLRQLPTLTDTALASELEALRQELNALREIDYEAVNAAKMRYLCALYKQEGAKTQKGKAYKDFVATNSSWLEPYARFCMKRDRQRSAGLYYYLQFVLSEQLRRAHDHAQACGVILKGDIPIGVNRDGVDVITDPQYFNLDAQAGAPPDDFSVNGQNWGFPTYNWEAMVGDGCRWWEQRFQNMAQYFDAYRIDHVLGFFRIWEIPIESVHGLLGQFAPSLGLTREEIETYGIHFQEEQFTQPFIADWTLERLFGEQAEHVKQTYLRHKHDDIWALRDAFNSQRKIEAYLGGAGADDAALREALYSLVSDVLFVRDHRDGSKFHPRIAAQSTFVYEALYGHDKEAFNRLYNDYFYRRNSQFWYSEAMKKLPTLVEATRMLVCAEDLGMVPDCVPWVMNRLRILSLEVQSMPKDPGVRFTDVATLPYRSVCCLGSHDMPTLRQWWDEDLSRTQDYFNNILHHQGLAPHPLPGWLAREILAQQLASPAMLCVLSLQDYLAIDEQLRRADKDAERINIPANPRHYWRYRMHVSIEQLLSNDSFVQNLGNLIQASGRN